MDTLLPLPSFMESAGCLDNQRLRKQRLDALQVLEACLSGVSQDEPSVVKMWRGYEAALCHFGMCCCYEWSQRGNVDNLYRQFLEKLPMIPVRRNYYPPWLGTGELHAAYREELLEENPEWYSRFNWDKIVEPKLAYLKGE